MQHGCPTGAYCPTCQAPLEALELLMLDGTCWPCRYERVRAWIDAHHTTPP